MKLSVIIVSYNVKHFLLQCIDSVKRATDSSETEIFVIDNHSKDDTVEALEREHGINLIASNTNHGFARANNIAINQSEGEYVLLLNPDTIVGENSIKECIDFLDNNPQAGAVGVCMLKSDGSKAMESRRGLPTPMTSFYKMCGLCNAFPDSKRFGRYYMSGIPWDKAAKIDVISGAYCMIRRKALNEAGLLDEDFFMYGEDIDLSYRLLKHGYENWYLPVNILHYKGESTQKSSFRYIHVFYEAMIIFFKKHYSHLSFWLNIPIKIAIYLKAMLALIQLSYKQTRKMLGFWKNNNNKQPTYVFIGEEDAIDKCRKITRKNGLEARFITGNERTKPLGHSDMKAVTESKSQICVVYDNSAYSYDSIFGIFSNNSQPNITIGTFDRRRKTIITDKEIIS